MTNKEFFRDFLFDEAKDPLVVIQNFRESIISECQALIQAKADEADGKARTSHGIIRAYHTEEMAHFAKCKDFLDQLKQEQA